MPDLVPIRRALLSVSDKTGLVDFARALHARGVTLISTGGTAKALADAGLPVTPVEQVTGAPEMMDGRVKTLHPKVHGGLLAVRDDAAHARAMREHGIEPIDLVCVNLYPFRAAISRPGVSLHDAIENIDIGGPSMVRSAAKNHEYVTVVTDPAEYARVLGEIEANRGATPLSLRRRLALEAFSHTAAYDATISAWLRSRPEYHGAGDDAADFPRQLTLTFDKAQEVRYGENPHQAAAVYRDPLATDRGVLGARQLHGKELSYNNVADAAAALALAQALSQQARRPAAAVIKHANPCGAGSAGDVASAVGRALEGDRLAAFGGILAVAGVIDDSTAALLTTKDTFLEVVIAEGFSPGALESLRSKSAAMRLLETGPRSAPSHAAAGTPWAIRGIPGGLLVQEADVLPPAPSAWTHAAGPALSGAELAAGASVELMVRAMNSNAIALGLGDESGAWLVGGGVGQVDRVTACRLAVEKAGPRARGAIAVSDAFFPFPDGPQVLIDAGARAIIHPGGSKRDQETFDLCAARGVSCYITGVRRFRH